MEEQTACRVYTHTYTPELVHQPQDREDGTKVEEQMACRVYTYTVPIMLPIHPC